MAAPISLLTRQLVNSSTC